MGVGGKKQKDWNTKGKAEKSEQQLFLIVSLICQFTLWAGFQHWSYLRCFHYILRTWAAIFIYSSFTSDPDKETIQIYLM